MNLLKKLWQKQIEFVDWLFPLVRVVRHDFEIIPKVRGDDFHVDYEVLRQSSVARRSAQKILERKHNKGGSYKE